MGAGLAFKSCTRGLLEIKGEVTMKRGGEKCSIKSERKARATTVLETFFKLNRVCACACMSFGDTLET